MPRIPEVVSQERLPTSSLQHEAGFGAAGVEARALAEGAAQVGTSALKFVETLKNNQDTADALDALSMLTETETQAADANTKLRREPDYRTHIERAEVAWDKIHQTGLKQTTKLGDKARLLATQELEKRKADFLVKARHQQQAMYKDEYRASMTNSVTFFKKEAMIAKDPGDFAKALTMLSGVYDIGVSGGLISQSEREAKQEKDLNQIYTLRAEGALDADPDQFLAEVSEGSWRFVDPVVLERMSGRAKTESRQRRTEAREDAEREEKRVKNAMKAAQSRVLSDGTGVYLDLIKKNAGVDEYQSALRAFESEADIFGVDKTTDDYRRVREALDKPFFSGGVDDPHVLNQVKLLVRLDKISENEVLGYRGRGVSEASLPGLIATLRQQKQEGDISTKPQFKEGRERIMIRIGRGAFSFPGLGGMMSPVNAERLERALDKYTQRSRSMFSKDGQDALGRLHDLAPEIIQEVEGDQAPRSE